MSENFKETHARYRALKSLESGVKTRSKLLLATRVKDKEASKAAIQQLVDEGLIIEKTQQTLKPGPNPRNYKITESGKEELERLKKAYL